jgi:cytochrome oxidase Cu insertion factor (SCO1/SenC/PrrC family)
MASETMMTTMLRAAAMVVLALVFSGSTMGGQAPAAPDISKLGPQVGTTVPPFEGVDQFGKPRTLASSAGPKGTMLVFFRSADW